MNIDRIIHQSLELAAVHDDLATAIGHLKSVCMTALVPAFGEVGRDIGSEQRDVFAKLSKDAKARGGKQIAILEDGILAVEDEDARVIPGTVAHDEDAAWLWLALEGIT